MCVSADKDSANDSTLPPALEGYVSRGRTISDIVNGHMSTWYRHTCVSMVPCTSHPLAPPTHSHPCHTPLPHSTPCPALSQSLQTAPVMTALQQSLSGASSLTPSLWSRFSSSSAVCRASTHSPGCVARGPLPPGEGVAACGFGCGSHCAAGWRGV